MEINLLQTPQIISQDKSIFVEALGRQWQLFRPNDLESIWNSMDEDGFDEDHIPYWTELWPATLALVSWLGMRKSEIENRLCLDLGCGLGLSAIIGAWLGSIVCAVDYEMEALGFARKNAEENGGQKVVWLAMDWRRPAFSKERFWRIWGGDILYEKRFAEPVADFLDWSLEPDGVAWIADPGRGIFESFLLEMEKRAWNCREVHSFSSKHLEARTSITRIWEIGKPRRRKYE